MLLKRCVLLVVLATFGAGLTSVPAAAVETTHTSVTMVGTGDYITGTEAWYWRDGDGTINISAGAGGAATGFCAAVSNGSHGNGDYFDLCFSPPTDKTLTAGTTYPATRYNMDIYGSGRGCGSVTGQFTVRDMAGDGSHFWITYDSHCEGGPTSTFGEIRYNMPTDPDLITVPTRIDWPASPGNAAARNVPVSVINTSAAPISVINAGITVGGSVFKIASNGCTTIAAGASCVINVGFRPPAVADYTGELTITDSSVAGTHVIPLTGSGLPVPVRAHVSVPKKIYKYAESVKVTASLTGTYANKQVSIYQRVGSAARALIATKSVDSTGKAYVTVHAKKKTSFIVVWTDADQASTASTTITVYARVVATLTGYSGKSGSYYTYTVGKNMYTRAVTTPPKPSQCLYFSAQVRTSTGAWGPYAKTSCVRMTSSGVGQAYLTYDKTRRGRSFRFRAYYGGDLSNLAVYSSWVYGKWV